MVKRDQQKILQAEASKQMTPSSSSCKKKYKGVRMRSWGSWVSEIRAPNQKTRIWLGSYSTPEAAARAYDAALLCLKGSSASLNFPNTSLDYIPDTIMSPKSIQRVAAAAAANCFPNNGISSGTTPPVSPTPSSLVSSPSMASSPSDQVDDVPLIQSLESISMMEPWYTSFDDLQSPKYIDQMFNLVPYDPPTVMDDFYEELSDIRLWSFP
ncbi:ethylene-responsive transcription factor ERF014-like protein [Gossypium australe]|uniref:Ethylene-responsive transcription factor ERF014-like protein n=1 Tax=Gossypium australe TaxID=47621 RepID=A0A5B6V8C4_9ROSI|nr:ethylene-responsive transcription factor ERF014-like protein [Gossypium australe]